MLRDRISSALHNLSRQVDQGEEFLEHREAECRRTKQGEVEVREDVKPAGEDEYGIEDDIPLHPEDRVFRPSRRWIAAHCVMEDPSSMRDSRMKRIERKHPREDGSMRWMEDFARKEFPKIS